MTTKNYINIIFRLLLLVISCFVFAYLFISTSYIYTITGIAILIVFQVWLIIRHFNQTNNYLTKFITHLKENDVSSVFSQKNIESYYPGLKTYLNDINSIITNIRIDKENQFLYLQYLVEHVGIGLIAFRNDGKVDLINSSAKQIFNIPTLHNIKSIDLIKKGFSNELNSLKPEEQRIFTIEIQNEIMHLAVKVSVLNLRNQDIRLYSFQNIKNEIDQIELESWQKLISVLTHEIMNSVTPITMLTSTISGFFKNGDDQKSINDINRDIISETLEGLEMIEDRGQGLMKFVNHFRKLSKLPEPDLNTVVVNELFRNVSVLLKDELNSENIDLKYEAKPENLQIIADSGQIQQILINLINNSSDALEKVKSKKIIMLAYEQDKKSVIIEIRDNGIGIKEELLEKIFIPFFTTKIKGSGIGLSLSRQIMGNHSGSISVKSLPGKGTGVFLYFLKFS